VSGIKILSFPVGLQLGYTTFCCFLRAWDIGDRKRDYIQKQWHKRESLVPGQENVVNTILINPGKILFTSVLQQTWTHKYFVKAWIKIALDLCVWKINLPG
jgi:hypothetical protein